MKVSIGSKIFEGPWGGGNLFVKNLKNYLESRGINVILDLYDSDIDLIILTDPRKSSYSSTYGHKDIMNYLNYINEKALVIHRFNECDERKDTKGVNQFMIEANVCSDKNIFVSNWLEDIYKRCGLIDKENQIIMTGADKEIFNDIDFHSWDGKSKFKIVTHHWGANANKGIDAYKTLDLLLENHNFKREFEFTFIGNLPKNIILKNTEVLKPMNNLEIASYLRNCHIYLTGSINEPAGMHHIEGALSGLPILYVESGGITEYCKNYGIQYTVDNLEEKLAEIKNNYKKFKKSLLNYEFTGNAMNEKYLNLFNNLMDERSNLLNSRKQRPTFRLKNQYKIINKYFYL